MDAQISVTASVDAAGYENVSQLDPTLLLGRVFGVLFPVACLWLSLWVWAWTLLGRCLSPLVLPLALFRFGGVQLWEKKGADPKTGSDSVITLRQASPSMFWDFGSLHQKHRVGGTHGRVRRDGSDGWRSPVHQGDNTGVQVVYFLRQPSSVSPADRSRTF